MKLNSTIKTLCAATVFAASAAAQAAPIYLDIGTSYYAADDAYTPTPTSTSIKNDMGFIYQSFTQLNPINGTFTTTFGWNQAANNGNLNSNQVTGFDPNQTSLQTSNNGYGVNFNPFTGLPQGWLISFKGAAQGTFTLDPITGLPVLSYQTGLIELFVLDPTTTTGNGSYASNNFLDVIITGGSTVPGNTKLDGVVDFTNVDSGYNDLIHSVTSNSGETGLFSIDEASDGNTPIYFTGNFNTSDAVFNPLTGTIKGDHSGRVQFAVPEPASLALIGMGLLGLGAIRRRKASV